LVRIQDFLAQLAIKRSFKFSPHPTCASALTDENGTHKMSIGINKKRQKKHPDIIDYRPITSSVWAE